MLRLLQVNPIPLINLERKLVILWSAKSACTMVYCWYAIISGFEDKVRGIWPHDHRQQYTFSAEYRRIMESDLSGFQIVKVLRDPYSRAVSIYRHALIHGAAFVDREIARWSKGEISFQRGGVSFQQFLDFLSSIDIAKGDLHLRPQWHPFETLAQPHCIINISHENLFSQLNRFERALNWTETDFEAHAWMHNLETSHRTSDQSLCLTEDVTPITRDTVSPFPHYDYLLTPMARAKIESIYARDFEAYSKSLEG